MLQKSFEDPDWRITVEFEKGVRIGVGTTLPWTLEVFEEKVKWRVPGQAEAGEDDVVEGAWRANYASAAEYVEEVEAVLCDQATRGQIAIFPEAVANQKFGSRLTVPRWRRSRRAPGRTGPSRSGSCTMVPTGSTSTRPSR